MSGEQLDHTAPTLRHARNAMMVSAMLGMYDTTRSPGATPISRNACATEATSRRNWSQEISVRGRSSDCAISAGYALEAKRNACSP